MVNINPIKNTIASFVSPKTNPSTQRMSQTVAASEGTKWMISRKERRKCRQRRGDGQRPGAIMNTGTPGYFRFLLQGRESEPRGLQSRQRTRLYLMVWKALGGDLLWILAAVERQSSLSFSLFGMSCKGDTHSSFILNYFFKDIHVTSIFKR